MSGDIPRLYSLQFSLIQRKTTRSICTRGEKKKAEVNRTRLERLEVKGYFFSGSLNVPLYERSERLR